jgi:serine/threonine protein kinase
MLMVGWCGAGACVKRPNLCIVTEFVKQGSLNDLLMDASVRLPWNQRMRMLRSAALGVNYLHSLSPCIVHRDLKPSNLLVRRTHTKQHTHTQTSSHALDRTRES